MVANGLVYEK